MASSLPPIGRPPIVVPSSSLLIGRRLHCHFGLFGSRFDFKSQKRFVNQARMYFRYFLLIASPARVLCNRCLNSGLSNGLSRKLIHICNCFMVRDDCGVSGYIQVLTGQHIGPQPRFLRLCPPSALCPQQVFLKKQMGKPMVRFKQCSIHRSALFPFIISYGIFVVVYKDIELDNWLNRSLLQTCEG